VRESRRKRELGGEVRGERQGGGKMEYFEVVGVGLVVVVKGVWGNGRSFKGLRGRSRYWKTVDDHVSPAGLNKERLSC